MKSKKSIESKKDQVIESIFKICRRKNNFVFHNNLVKDVCKKIGFGNPFDVTKLDNKTKLPDILVKNYFKTQTNILNGFAIDFFNCYYEG